jgi:plastocyanin
MNKNAKIGIIIAVVVVLGVGAIALTKNKSTTTSGDNMTHPTSTTGGGTTQSSSKLQDTNQITYKGFAVVQKAIRVKKGTTVTWTNEDNAKHDVTPDTETAEFKTSELFGKGETHSVTFNTVGTYTYHCSPHPYMKGSIEVTE